MSRMTTISRAPLRRGLATAFLALLLMQPALADDAAAPASPSAASPAPSGRGGGSAAPSQGVDLHHLPPDSTTSQKLVLPDRTLAFHATAGSIRLYDAGKGEPAGRYRLHGLSARRRRSPHPARDLLLQRWARRLLGLAAARQCGPLALADGRARRPFRRRGPISCPTPTPGSISPISSSSIRWAPAIAASSRAAMTCASNFYSVDGDADAGAVTIRRWLEQANRLTSPKFISAKAMAASAGRKHRLEPADRARRRHQRDDPRFACARLPRVPGLEPHAICRRACPRWRPCARAKGRVTRAAWRMSSATRRAIISSTSSREEATPQALDRLSDKVASLDRARQKPRAPFGGKCRRKPSAASSTAPGQADQRL